MLIYLYFYNMGLGVEFPFHQRLPFSETLRSQYHIPVSPVSDKHAENMADHHSLVPLFQLNVLVELAGKAGSDQRHRCPFTRKIKGETYTPPSPRTF